MTTVERSSDTTTAPTDTFAAGEAHFIVLFSSAFGRERLVAVRRVETMLAHCNLPVVRIDAADAKCAVLQTILQNISGRIDLPQIFRCDEDGDPSRALFIGDPDFVKEVVNSGAMTRPGTVRNDNVRLRAHILQQMSTGATWSRAVSISTDAPVIRRESSVTSELTCTSDVSTVDDLSTDQWPELAEAVAQETADTTDAQTAAAVEAVEGAEVAEAAPPNVRQPPLARWVASCSVLF